MLRTDALPDQETGSWRAYGATRECNPSEVFLRLAYKPPVTRPRPVQRGLATSFFSGPERLLRSDASPYFPQRVLYFQRKVPSGRLCVQPVPPDPCLGPNAPRSSVMALARVESSVW